MKGVLGRVAALDGSPLMAARSEARRFARPRAMSLGGEAQAKGTEVAHCPVLLVGAFPIVLAGLAAVLADEPVLQVIGEVHGGAAALQAAALASGMVVFAVAAWTGACDKALAVVQARHPQMRVVLVVEDEDPARLQQFFAGGGYAAVPMRASVAQVVATICAAHPSAAPAARDEAAVPMVEERQAGLSAREWLVLRRKIDGHSNKAIAGELEISTKTVETYYARGMDKLGLHSRAEMMRYATAQGWLTGP